MLAHSYEFTCRLTAFNALSKPVPQHRD
jgi:hypothetical protein